MIPVLIGIVVGYLVAVPFGYVDFTPVLEAAWIGLPSITLPTWSQLPLRRQPLPTLPQ